METDQTLALATQSMDFVLRLKKRADTLRKVIDKCPFLLSQGVCQDIKLNGRWWGGDSVCKHRD